MQTFLDHIHRTNHIHRMDTIDGYMGAFPVILLSFSLDSQEMITDEIVILLRLFSQYTKAKKKERFQSRRL